MKDQTSQRSSTREDCIFGLMNLRDDTQKSVMNIIYFLSHTSVCLVIFSYLCLLNYLNLYENHLVISIINLIHQLGTSSFKKQTCYRLYDTNYLYFQSFLKPTCHLKIHIITLVSLILPPRKFNPTISKMVMKYSSYYLLTTQFWILDVKFVISLFLLSFEITQIVFCVYIVALVTFIPAFRYS